MQEKHITRASNTILPLQPSHKIPTRDSSVVPPIVAILLDDGEERIAEQLLSQVNAHQDIACLVMRDLVEKDPRPGGDVELSEGISKRTKTPVIIASHETPVEAGCVYVIPEGMSLQLVRGRLLIRGSIVSQRDDKGGDLFLATVASAAPDRHLVVVTEGMVEKVAGGLRVVRAEGGFSILTAANDLNHLRPGECGADFFEEKEGAVKRMKELIASFPQAAFIPTKEMECWDIGRFQLQLLHEKGVDISRYRRKDVLRRIHRRMIIHGISDLDAYCRILQEEFEELNLLYEELQFCDAGFFLDPLMEHALMNDILPVMMEQWTEMRPIRLWIPRCTGGQEAYSVAIFMTEWLQERGINLPVKIFATDLNLAAIERARLAIYEAADLEGTSAKSRTRYFLRTKEEFQVCRTIREMCVFATHDLIKDPPYSRVDIILGRLSVAGFSGEAIDKVFRNFHYALNPAGFLLPGRIRSREYPKELFELRNDNPFIFVRKEASAAHEPSAGPSAVHLGEQEADRMLLAGYVPAAMLVDGQLRVLRFYGNVEPYLRASTDRLSLHLLRMVKDELVFELDELIEQSDKQGKSVRRDLVSQASGEHGCKISIEVAPLRSLGRKWRLVIIREVPVAPVVPERHAGRGPTSKDFRIMALEKELLEMRGLLMTASEDASEIQQALQQGNEEIMASNEELQSINEQLQSANDELLSSNVELNTVNEDLHVRNRELERSVEYADAILGSLNHPLVVIQEDLRIRTANAAFYDFFRLEVGRVKGRRIFAVGEGIFNREELRTALRQIRLGKSRSASLELQVDIPAQGERVLVLSLSRMSKVRDIPPGLVLSIEDATERKAMERLKDEFIGIASHELKSPATTIQAYSQLLFKELSEAQTPQPLELVKRLNGQVTRLTRLTRDLLDVTKIGQGQVYLDEKPFDIGRLIADTVEEMQVTTSIKLVIRETSPLPFFKGDAERIGQVLVNLLTNAIKYAPGTNEIIVGAEVKAGLLNITVRDFGVGMSPESQQKIFDRFYRTEEATGDHRPGAGLGLYISSEIVRKHGGFIQVCSEKDKGSVFTIRLPMELDGGGSDNFCIFQ